MVSQEEFLRRVRQAARQGSRYRVTREQNFPSDIGYVGAGPDPTQTLLQELRAAGANADHISSVEQLHAVLTELFARHSVKEAMCWRHPLLEQCAVYEWLAQQGVRIQFPTSGEAHGHNDAREASFAAEVGISSVDWAVAETGTLVLGSAPDCASSASLLPPVHVALVHPSQIVSDLFDLFDRLSPSVPLPSQLALITGPSKTGDIELRLTTGVHGPREVHVFVLSPTVAPPFASD